MEISKAIEALSALAQESRLKVFRLLVRQGPSGMAAGEIARTLQVPNNTMSAHLATLSRAGLIASRKESRSVIYAVDLAGTRALLSFLLEDCCRGRSELCAPLIEATLEGCCGEAAACCQA
jgi:ArsR family transcriptional regulator, arsenate/arsenite/antimonite-responsive transcriptional repressor